MVETAPAGGSTWKPEPPRKPVPVGYVHLPGHGYYKYHTTRQEWNAARITCQSEGGHLAVLNSEAEAKFIAKIPTASYHWAFIGMHDYFKEGQWITIFGEFYPGFYNNPCDIISLVEIFQIFLLILHF